MDGQNTLYEKLRNDPERIFFFDYAEKQILFINISNLKNTDNTEESLKIIDKAIKVAMSKNEKILTLTDVTNLKYNTPIIKKINELALVTKPYSKKAAIIGIAGLTKIAYNAAMSFSGRNIPTFNTFQEAVNWLILEDGETS